MPTDSPLHMTPEEFYAWEELQPVKHQYYKGEAYAMAGTSVDHNQICINIVEALRKELQVPCRVFTLDLMVHAASGLNTYPDVFVVCGELEFDDRKKRVIKNPRIIIEVLSPSTETYDRGLKFDHYKTIPTLQEYLLVSQDRLAVDHSIRGEGTTWLTQYYRSLADSIQLTSAKASLKLREIYDQVILPEPEDPNVTQLRIYGDDR